MDVRCDAFKGTVQRLADSQQTLSFFPLPASISKSEIITNTQCGKHTNQNFPLSDKQLEREDKQEVGGLVSSSLTPTIRSHTGEEEVSLHLSLPLNKIRP